MYIYIPIIYIYIVIYTYIYIQYIYIYTHIYLLYIYITSTSEFLKKMASPMGISAFWAAYAGWLFELMRQGRQVV